MERPPACSVVEVVAVAAGADEDGTVAVAACQRRMIDDVLADAVVVLVEPNPYEKSPDAERTELAFG